MSGNVCPTFLSTLCGLPNRNAVIRYLKDNSPKIRERTSGPVGPELDYSILYARIPQRDWVRSAGDGVKAGYRPVLTSDITGCKIDLVRSSRDIFALHGHVETVTLNEEGIRRWTEHAQRMGIRFSGDYEYILPGKRTAHKYRKEDFDILKSKGLIPSGGRSREARLRRRESRRENDWLSAARKSSPLEIKEPLVVRSSKSARALASSWWRSHPRVKWSVYRSSQVIDPVLTLWPKAMRRQVSPIVERAVQKIYSRVEYVPKDVLTFGKETQRPQVSLTPFSWRVPEPPLPVSKPIPPLSRRINHYKSGDDGRLYAYSLGGQTTL